MGQIEVSGIRHLDEGSQIDGILGAGHVVACQQLERDQMTDPRYRQNKGGEHFDPLGRLRYLRFDTGGGEEQIDDVVARTQRQAHGGQSVGDVLLDCREYLVAIVSERTHNCLGSVVAGDRYHKIDISGEPRLAPNRDAKPSDQRVLHAERFEMTRRRARGRLEVCHREVSGRG